MASKIWEWAQQYPDTEYCTWGFGELAPVGTSTNPDDYVPSAANCDLIDTLGQQTLTALVTNIYKPTGGQCNLVGSTKGAVRSKSDCTASGAAAECATCSSSGVADECL